MSALNEIADIYAQSRWRAAPEGECGYISKAPSMSVLQRLYNINQVVYCTAHN